MAKPIVTLFLLWAISLGVIALLQVLGAGVGFRIGPLGEDFNWVYFLQHHQEYPAQQAFWEYDARNPLAPWWYLAVKPLILDTAYGIYAVRKVADLGCGLSVYAVVSTLGGVGCRRLAVAAGGLAMLWTCSQMVGQINWTMLMAVSLSLFAVAAYVRFLNGARTEAGWYAASLVLYLVSIGTYSLQASAALSIGALGVRRDGWRKGGKDAAPFFALLTVFFLIWSTAGQVPANNGSLAVGNVVRSLGFLVWDPVYSHVVTEMWQLQRLDLWLVAGMALMTGVMFWRICGNVAEQGDGRGSLAVELGIVALGLCAATVALEATNSVWVPGTRSPMVQQGLAPLMVTALVLSLGGRWRRSAMLAAWSLAAFLSLCHNGRQVRWTVDLERIAAGLKAAVPVIRSQTVFVLTSAPLSLSAYNSDIFVKNLYRSDDVNLKVFSPATGRSHGGLLFDADPKGLFAESTLGQRRFVLRGVQTWIPYRNVILMRYDETGVRRVDRLRREETKGYQVVFNRQRPVYAGDRKPGPPLLLEKWEITGGTRPEPGVFKLPGQPVGLAQHAVTLQADGEYVVEFEARAEGDTRAFYADFYGGQGYDSAEQDHVIGELGPGELGREFRWVRFVIPAGAAPPSQAWLRLVNPSPGTVWVRSVRISRLDTMEVGLLRP